MWAKTYEVFHGDSVGFPDVFHVFRTEYCSIIALLKQFGFNISDRYWSEMTVQYAVGPLTCLLSKMCKKQYFSMSNIHKGLCYFAPFCTHGAQFLKQLELDLIAS